MQSSDDVKNVTPLHIAAESGHLACLQLLVQQGGNILATDTEHLTPVDYAEKNGKDLCLSYLNDVLGMLLIDGCGTRNSNNNIIIVHDKESYTNTIKLLLTKLLIYMHMHV